ncbi:MAG: hypothetical protein Fur0021_30780 [Candidatus Promineifilaceae bacterium]
MKQTTRWITLFVLILSLTALACGFGGSEEPVATMAPAATASTAEEETAAEMPAETAPTSTTAALPPAATTEAPAATAAPAEAQAGAEQALTAAQLAEVSSALKSHNSYHAVITMNFTGTAADGSPVSTAMNMDMVTVQNPPASRFSITMSGLPDQAEAQVIEMTTIGDTVYTSMTGLGCFSGSSADMSGFADSFDTIINPEEDLLTDLQSADYVGQETHNGFVSDCYAFDQNDIGEEFEDAEELNGLVCLSKEYGIVSHIQLDATGVSDQFTGGDASAQGNLTLTYDVIELDQVAELTIPADCEVDSAASDWPMMADAANVSQFQGIVIYSTNMPFAEVVSFYQTEMAALGYQPDGEPLDLGENSTVLGFMNDTGKLSVTITSLDDSGTLQVLISPSQ